MHNLSTVFRFEVIRTLKKKSFWIMTLSLPLILGVVFGIVILSNQATEDAVKKVEKQQFSILVKDDSGLIKKDTVASMGINQTADRDASIEQVRSGKVDAFFYYPAKLTGQVEVYGKDVGIFNNGRYAAVANALLSTSVNDSVDANTKAALTGKIQTNTVTYKDGIVSDPIMQMIAPGLFLLLFYFLIAMFGNQALTSTTEEKENRVIEMLLTTVQARTLVIGKILSLVVLAFIQAFTLIIPAVAGYMAFHDKLALPSLNLSAIPLDPARIMTAAVIFAASFMLFIGLLVTIGAAVPTAKEAGSFLGVVMILLFGPLYAASLFISAPEQPFVQFLSYFPFTAPIPLLLRNAAGTITLPEALLATLILVIAAIFVIRLAVRIFRFGALEYSRKLSFREIFGRS